MGTAGSIYCALSKLDEQFIVIYGDTYFDIDLKAFWKFHLEKLSDISIFLHPNDHPYDSDLVEIDSDFLVKKIYPYPHDNKWRQNLVNAAIYIFNKSVFEIKKFSDSKFDIAKDFFPQVLKHKKRFFGYVSTEYIKDMGTPKRLEKVKEDIKSNKVKLLNRKTQKRAIFLDRDGTINEEVNHLSNQDQFKLLKGVGEAISKINSAGFLTVVVTNQPVIARGYLKEPELKTIHNKMETLLGNEGAYIDKIYYCPHHQDKGFDGEIKELKYECDCRKPKTGMFMQAKKDLNIIFEKSWVIGDRTSDILVAKKLKMKSLLVQTGYAGKDRNHEAQPDFLVEDLNEAVSVILEEIKLDDC